MRNSTVLDSRWEKLLCTKMEVKTSHQRPLARSGP
jgi:hypothetical protein